MNRCASKRIKMSHNFEVPNNNNTCDTNANINYKTIELLESQRAKINLLDNKINQIGEMCNHLIQTSNYNKHYINELNDKMNLIHQKNESIKLEVLKEITSIQNLIIDKLMNNNFTYNIQNVESSKEDEPQMMPNEMMNAYS